MRIINQAEELAVWLLHRRDYDIVASFGDWLVDRATMAEEMIDRRLYIVHTKIRPRAVRHVSIWVEPELVAAHVKPDIKRLVEIRLYAEYIRPPGFICLQIAEPV